MRVSLNWLRDFVNVDVDVDTLADTFTLHSMEVASTEKLVDASNLVIGYVESCEAHPNADKLSVCEVDVGTQTLTIVCGAPNVAAGQHVIVALEGATLAGGLTIKNTSIRSVNSHGMICSLSELGLEMKYHQETGIHVIEDAVKVGTDALEALGFNDDIVELDLTPNRMDLLSMHGVAYDVAAMFDTALTIPEPKVRYSDKTNPMTISSDTDACQAYYGSVIENITIKPSPAWMKARLIAAGIRPINNVVDITNYVMLETGQPLHAFDYTLLNSDTIVVREARQGETFTTLDDKTRILEAGDILITDGKRPIALGGVMGGAETEVHAKTTSILLESAAFSPLHVRRTATRLDLRSESSMRFEKGIDVGKIRYALDRATALLIEYAGATVRNDVAYFDALDRREETIELSLNTLNKVLGIELPKARVEDLLKRLRFQYSIKGDVIAVVKPTRRPDFENYQDLIEEIGRIHGYASVPETLPATVSVGELTEKQRFRRAVRETLLGLGLNEAKTYSLRSADTVGRYALEKGAPVSVKHPMSERRAVLRLSPIGGLLEAVAYNAARGQTSVHLFEIGHIYTDDGEIEKLAGIMHGQHQSRYWQTTPALTFYTAKAIVEALFDRFGVQATYTQATLEDFHPHQAAFIDVGETRIGHIAKVHPTLASKQDLEDVYAFELDLDALYGVREDALRHQPIDRYPAIERDIAIVIDREVPAGDVVKAVTDTGIGALREVKVFDVYEGSPLDADKKSLGIRMVFKDPEGTLKAEHVDRRVDAVVEQLNTVFGATLR